MWSRAWEADADEHVGQSEEAALLREPRAEERLQLLVDRVAQRLQAVARRVELAALRRLLRVEQGPFLHAQSGPPSWRAPRLGRFHIQVAGTRDDE